MATMINYYYYKNFVYTLMQLLFSTVNCFSMQTVFPDMFLTMYNMCFTAIPIMVYACEDKDIYPLDTMDSIAFKPFIPSLYFAGQRNIQLNQYVFLLWSTVGLF